MLPKISIITPSYNQGHFIEETIQSILTQNYPNLEYIIIDGSSTDDTVEIIKKYEDQLTYWISEPDRGQTHAINKGLELATGDIIAYINSDDYYLPGTFAAVASYFQNNPDTDLLHGRCRYVDEQGNKIGEQFGQIECFDEIVDLWGVWWNKRQFVQPEVFWSRRIFEKVGPFKENLHYVMDYDYWARILLSGGKVGKLDQEISCFRFTDNQKSNDSVQVADELRTVVEPLLWNSSTPIAFRKRLRLQSQWLYDSVFLKQVEKSVSQQESKATRTLKSLGIIPRHPKILLNPSFRCRAFRFLFG